MTGHVVRDEAGNRYVPEKRSEASSRVRDPETGERGYETTETTRAAPERLR